MKATTILSSAIAENSTTLFNKILYDDGNLRHQFGFADRASYLEMRHQFSLYYRELSLKIRVIKLERKQFQRAGDDSSANSKLRELHVLKKLATLATDRRHSSKEQAQACYLDHKRKEQIKVAYLASIKKEAA